MNEEVARRLGAAARCWRTATTGFWRPGCAAGARRGWFHHSSFSLLHLNNGAAAGNRTRSWRCASTSVAGMHSAVKPQPQEIEEPGDRAPGPCHFNKEQTPLG